MSGAAVSGGISSERGGEQAGIRRESAALSAPAYQLVVRILGSPDEAEDVVQQAYLKALRGGAPDVSGAELRTWFLRVAANAAKDHLRLKRARIRKEYAVRQYVKTRNSEGPTDTELLSALRVAVAALEAKYRVPVTLCCEQGLSRREAAEVLEMPERTVSKYVNIGLKKLRSALACAGYPAGSPAVLGVLRQTAPATPSSLGDKVRVLLKGSSPPPAGVLPAGAAGEGGGAPVGAVAVTVKAKGGFFGMKLMVGAILLAGAATGTFIYPAGNTSGAGANGGGEVLPAGAGGKEKAAAAVKPKQERIAIAVDRGYLDGPANEAFLMMHRGLDVDEEGNLYLKPSVGLGSIRCVRIADWKMVTITGDDRWCGNLGLTEGPAAFMPDLCGAVGSSTGYGSAGGGWFTVAGAPLKGEKYGCLYAGIGGYPYKVFKNDKQGGRWWFKRLGTGKQGLPTATGGTVKLEAVNLRGVTFNGGVFAHAGRLYRFDPAKNEITCLLSVADYRDHVPALKRHGRVKVGDSMGAAERIGLAPDGTFFLSYYNKSYPAGRIFRVSADRKEVKEIVRNARKGIGNQDGPGLKTRWHCGPMGFFVCSGNIIFVNSIDSNRVRRWFNGRVAHLCLDGKWRECGPGQNVYNSSVRGKGWKPVKAAGKWYIYIFYPGEESCGVSGIYRFGPFVPEAPTVGKLVK